MSPVLLVGLALGLHHGTDPDHLAAIDGLTRLRPRHLNGVYFALGHGLIVTLLAAGIGHFLAARLAFLSPWMLVLIGGVTLWRLVHPEHTSPNLRGPVVSQPLLLGMLLAAGFETSSQLSALVLAGRTNPWLLGLVFSAGMVLVDGLDGFLAATTQRKATEGQASGKRASFVLGIVVVLFSFCLGGAEIAGIDLNRIALPLGLTLFGVVAAIRIWARMSHPSGRSNVLRNSESGLDII
jgi:high-affinity nickel-transport protein